MMNFVVFEQPKNEKLIFSFYVLGGFSGSGTLPGGFFGKFQYRTPRFSGVSSTPILQRWSAKFSPSFLMNPKVQFLKSPSDQGISPICKVLNLSLTIEANSANLVSNPSKVSLTQ